MPSEEGWAHTDRLLELALDLPPEQRAAFIEDAASGNPDLRAELLALVAADADASRFLEQPLVERQFLERGLFEPDPSDPSGADLSGDRLGPYRLLEVLGHGGMGTVYLAERDDGFRRRVAIKVLRRDLPVQELERRLRVERQILARLEHPYIARLYDGGTTEDGLPFLVMEYVEGEPIDVYCRRQGLDVEAKLRLLLKVCEAVEHAHRNLLVHRDLKPANILVTAEGEPRLLDFGIAKLLDVEHFEVTRHATRTGLRPMTLDFASPEQVQGETIATSSDVYSLGVVLFHLLTGSGPYRPRRDLPHALEASILEQEPRRPSEVAAEAGDAPLARRLRGDLDTILLKALRKEPARRYGSVRELAEDLERHLTHRPVLARPESFAYRVSKLLRRHTVGALTTAAVSLLIIGFAVVTTFQSARLARERDLAEAQRVRSEQVSGLLLDLLSRADPEETRGEELTVREVLDRGASRLDRLADQPEIQAAAMATMGRVYRGLGLYPEAEPLLETALGRRRELHGENHPDIAESLTDLGILRQLQGRPEEAEELLRRSLAVRQRIHGSEHPLVAESLNDLGLALYDRGDLDAASVYYRQALDMMRRFHGNDSPETAAVLASQASVHHDRAEVAEASRLYRQALEIRNRSLGEDHPETLNTLNNLAVLLQESGNLAEAEELHRQSLELRRRLYGPRHPAVANALSNLGRVLHARGNLEEAVMTYEEALGHARERLGEHPYVAAISIRLARALRDRGDPEAAATYFEEGLERERKRLGDDSVGFANLMDELAGALEEAGRTSEAEALYRESLEIDRSHLPADHYWVARSETLLARLLVRGGRFSEAEELVARTLPILRQRAETVDRPGQPDYWRAVVAEAEAVWAACLGQRAQEPQAESLLRRSHATLTEIRGAWDPGTRFAAEQLEGYRHPVR